MYYFYCLLLLATGAGLAMYGLKKFGLSLTLAFAIPSICLLGMFNALGTYSIAGVLVVSILIFFLTTPLLYFNSWFFGAVLVALPFAIIYNLIGVDPSSGLYKATVYVAMAASLVLTIIFRRHLKAIVIGITSGLSVGLGLSGLFSAGLFKSGQILAALALPGAIIFIAIAGGIAFQYLYVAKKNPELINPNLPKPAQA